MIKESLREKLKELRKDYPPVNLKGARMSAVRLDYADLERANLTAADLTNASLVGANMRGTVLKGTILKGADLTNVKNLTLLQLSEAITDEATRLPSYLVEEATIPSV